MSTNPYKRLLALLPQRPLQIGTVLSISGGVVVLEMPGGGRATARGAASVGQRVFFRDGNVEGIAPSLTPVSAEV
jgi:hypothetical protein